MQHGEYCVFHDESMPNKRWFLIGLSFVKKADIDRVREKLRATRNNYCGEIHFSSLPGSFDGLYGTKARVALSWMQLFQDRRLDSVCFSCLAVDRYSQAYEHRRFTHDFHAYNRFTAMALKAGIAWHIGPEKLDRINITFVSDAKDRATMPDRNMVDNFEDYLPHRAKLDSRRSQSIGRTFPAVQMRIELRDSASDDLLQLTDLLLGAVQMALVAKSSRPVKRKLGKLVVQWHEDCHRPPLKRQYRLHGPFDLWGFPNDKGRYYNKLPFELRDNLCDM